MPGSIARVLVPHFRLKLDEINPGWLDNMVKETSFYSKSPKARRGGGKARTFKDDSEKKEESASPEVEAVAATFMADIYGHMQRTTQAAMHDILSHDEYIQAFESNIEDIEDQYATLKPFPSAFPGANYARPPHKSEQLHTNSVDVSSSAPDKAESSDKGVEHHEGMHAHSEISGVSKIEDMTCPFVNSHGSKPFEKVACPEQPELA